jgi:integrase
MRGQIVQRSQGSWTIILYIGRDPTTGRKRYRQHTIRGAKRDAERERVRLLRALDTGTYLEPSRQSVGEYLEHWLREYAKIHVAQTTYERYANIVRLQLIPAFGHVPLLRLSPHDIKAHYASAIESGRSDGKGGLSPTTVLQHHRLLREALKHAVNDGLLVTNPADRVRAPRRVRREMAVLDQAQTSRLLELVKGERLHIPVLLAVAAGLRRGEVLGLRWQDLDLKAGKLSVRQALEATKQGGLTLKAPKTAKSRRLVPLPPFAIEALREHKRLQAHHRLRLGPAFHNHDLVCPAPDGMPWNPDTLTPAFVDFVRRSGLPRIRFHDLRHGHATLLLKFGIHPKIVSERLGHATVGLTRDTYSHVLPGMQEHAASILEDALRLPQ